MCLCLWQVSMGTQRGQKSLSGPLELGFTGSCELSILDARNWIYILWKKSTMLVIAKQSLLFFKLIVEVY